MKSLIFTDINNTLVVEYVTDLISPTAENFTVMSIVGLNNTEIQAGMQFGKIAYTLSAFKTFATNNFLKLQLVDYKGTGSTTTLVDATAGSSGGGVPLGIDNI